MQKTVLRKQGGFLMSGDIKTDRGCMVQEELMSNPLSFVIDEIRPVSKYKMFGYESKKAAAMDWSNLQAAHWICNAIKGAKGK